MVTGLIMHQVQCYDGDDNDVDADDYCDVDADDAVTAMLMMLITG